MNENQFTFTVTSLPCQEVSRSQCLYRICQSQRRKPRSKIQRRNDSKKMWIGSHGSAFPILPGCLQNTYDNSLVPFPDEDFRSIDVEGDVEKQWSKHKPFKTKGTQTDYRESECQTVPWDPPYKIAPGHSPEILSIAHLTWGNGLPAGPLEIELINRMRRKRAQDAVLPPMDTPANRKAHIAIITKQEAEEWAFRDSEIDCIHDLRMELIKKLKEKCEAEREKITEKRLKLVNKQLTELKIKEIKTIRHKYTRSLRKLTMQHRAKIRSQSEGGIIRMLVDHSSKLHAPKLRYGGICRHEVLNRKFLQENFVDNAEDIDTTPNLAPFMKVLTKPKTVDGPIHLCIRQTRWTEEKFQQLHNELQDIRFGAVQLDELSILKRKRVLPELPETPVRIKVDGIDKELESAAVLLQKTVRGRAIQCMMYEGRDRCRELIEELQSTHTMQSEAKSMKGTEQNDMLAMQREHEQKIFQERRKNEILEALEGQTFSYMMDTLSKELTRLENERTSHALAMVAERQRVKKQIEDDSRKHVELLRQEELDEMYRQILKVNQESVETYLEDIIKQGVEWVSDQEAKKYITELADKANAVAKYTMENSDKVDEDGLIADMIYNFVLPEAQKQIERKKIHDKQISYLQGAHSALYQGIVGINPDDFYEEKNSLEEISVEEPVNQSNEISQTEDSKSCAEYVLNHILSQISFEESRY